MWHLTQHSCPRWPPIKKNDLDHVIHSVDLPVISSNPPNSLRMRLGMGGHDLWSKMATQDGRQSKNDLDRVTRGRGITPYSWHRFLPEFNSDVAGYKKCELPRGKQRENWIKLLKTALWVTLVTQRGWISNQTVVCPIKWGMPLSVVVAQCASVLE